MAYLLLPFWLCTWNWCRLDVGDGKEENLEKCPRTVLQRQCIKYLGPVRTNLYTLRMDLKTVLCLMCGRWYLILLLQNERETYEVIVTSGKLVYRQSGNLVTTTEGTKWIFVLSASRIMYVAEKKKGYFQHSSFLSGGATIAAGRLVASDGVLEVHMLLIFHTVHCQMDVTFLDI